MQQSNYTRNCPSCGKELTYKSPVSFKYAQDNNQKCKGCCKRKNRIAPELVQQILELNATGILNREIARALGIHHRTVAEYLKKHGKEQNFANQPIDMVSDKEARCRKCGDVKSIEEFQWGRKGQKYEYKFSYCNKCRKQQVYLNLNEDTDKFLADKYNRLINRCKKFSIVCTLTKEEFIEQFHKQEGLCFYTDELMVCEVGAGKSRNSASVDKIVPDKGYVSGNFVFATNKVNTSKNDLSLDEIQKWMPEWHRRIQNYLKEKQ